MKIEIRADSAFDPYRELAHYQESLIELRGKFGASASFIGTMRDFNEGDEVHGMTLEHYPGMTEKHLTVNRRTGYGALAPVGDTSIIHRVGDLVSE